MCVCVCVNYSVIYFLFFHQSCLTAIDEMFNSKLHVIGGVGIGIGVIMVSWRSLVERLAYYI